MNNSYLIIGGTGSLGRALIWRFLSQGDRVTVVSRDEAKHWTLKNDLKNTKFNTRDFNCLVGDVRDENRLREIVKNGDPGFGFNFSRVIVAAALKHVDTCELSPFESIQTNMLGTQAVINALRSSKFKGSLCFVSTDKACAPVNVYGMCKALSERLVTSQPYHRDDRFFKTVVVRYGNVLESRGSIIPLFKHQVQTSEVITVTDPEMTRFVMTLDQSVDLIQDAFDFSPHGTIRIPVLPAMKIGDLAEIFAKRYSKHIKIVGQRPGEKMHEDLINMTESQRTINVVQDDKTMRVKKSYLILEPTATNVIDAVHRSYSSNHNVMTPSALESHLNKLGIFDKSLDQFIGRKIEEIVS